MAIDKDLADKIGQLAKIASKHPELAEACFEKIHAATEPTEASQRHVSDEALKILYEHGSIINAVSAYRVNKSYKELIEAKKDLEQLADKKGWRKFNSA